MNKIEKSLKRLSDPERAKILSRFFKTDRGQYGEGDIFWGITVPEQRKVAQENINSTFEEIKELISHKIHECRLTGFLILTYQFENADEKIKKQIYNFYLKNKVGLNNWDLVDVTAPKIIGRYLLKNKRDILYKLAYSKNLWDKRIAVISTYTFISQKQFSDTLKICRILLNDKHDLLHKACGWMLREIGKRDRKILVNFLEKFYKKMPRTMFRYAVEKFSPEEKSKFIL